MQVNLDKVLISFKTNVFKALAKTLFMPFRLTVVALAKNAAIRMKNLDKKPRF